MNFLVRRGGVYLYRRTIPREIRLLLGKREFKVSLSTGDLAQAQKRHPVVHAQAERELQEARAGIKNPHAQAYRGSPIGQLNKAVGPFQASRPR